MSASKNIKHALIENKMQQKELAEKLNITGASLSQMLSKDNMGYNRAEEIAEILGYEIVWRKKDTGEISQSVSNSGVMEIGIQNNIKDKVEEIADLLGCEIVWKEKDTREISQSVSNSGVMEIGIQNNIKE